MFFSDLWRAVWLNNSLNRHLLTTYCLMSVSKCVARLIKLLFAKSGQSREVHYCRPSGDNQTRLRGGDFSLVEHHAGAARMGCTPCENRRLHRSLTTPENDSRLHTVVVSQIDYIITPRDIGLATLFHVAAFKGKVPISLRVTFVKQPCVISCWY